MNILVCIKQVPETNKVEADPVTGVLLRNGVDSKMNPYDLYALETALRIKEEHGGKVSVISMGPPQALQIIKEAYAMGADDGVLLSDRRFGGADVLATSYTLAQGIKNMGTFDLILCGKQTTDGDTAQVGPEISEWLKIPGISNVTDILEATKTGITVGMDMSEDIEYVKLQFPCLISVDKDIFQPRLPSYRKKMVTAGREIRILTLQDMEDQDEAHYGLNGSPTRVERIFPPPCDAHREFWKDDSGVMADRLFDKLKELKYI
jgi:electron transfer flavoprotein beta subunit